MTDLRFDPLDQRIGRIRRRLFRFSRCERIRGGGRTLIGPCHCQCGRRHPRQNVQHVPLCLSIHPVSPKVTQGESCLSARGGAEFPVKASSMSHFPAVRLGDQPTSGPVRSIPESQLSRFDYFCQQRVLLLR